MLTLKAIVHKLKELRLFNLIWNWENGQILIRKFMALALLPDQMIEITFDWLTQILPNEIMNVLMPFIRYFRRQWIRNIRPEQLSVFGLINRTNNYSEAYNRVLRLRLGAHPTIWDFTGKNFFNSVNINNYKNIDEQTKIFLLLKKYLYSL